MCSSDLGDLILESNSGDTTAIITGFYSNPGSEAWLLTDSTGAAQVLSQWASASEQGSTAGGGGAVDPAAQYTQEINGLRQQYADTIVGTLEGMGARDESIDFPNDPTSASQYDFTGVSTQNVTVQGGALGVGQSESDVRQIVTVSGGTRTETISVPVYGYVQEGGVDIYIPASGPDTTPGDQVFVNLGDDNAPGFSPVAGSSGGFDYIVPPKDVLAQTGTRTETITVPVTNFYVDETKGFTDYNVTGDGGNDIITSAPPVYGNYGYATTRSTFVGTVDTGNGDVFVGLGLNWFDNPDNQSVGWGNQSPQDVIPLGAFVQAGNGNDDIWGTYGADTIAAGLGSDTITAAWGSTVYVPMLDGSSDYINIVDAPEYGNGPFTKSTLVLPEGVTPEDLEYNILPDPNGTDGGSNSRILQITYGSSSVYLTYDSGAPSWYLTNADSDDNDGINQFEFSDGTVLSRTQLIAMATANAAANSGGDYDPVVTQLTSTLSGTSPVAASSLFSASDAGGTIELYQISNNAASGGYFTLNGTTYVPGATVTVTAGELSELQYNPVSVGASDTLQVEAFDGVNWSSQSQVSFSVNGGTASLQGTGPYQLVLGLPTGPDTLVGGYAGDTLVGSSGDDTFDYNAGSGAETIREVGNSSGTPPTDTLDFGAGITPQSITTTLVDGSDLVLSIGTSGDSVDLSGIDPGNPLATLPVQQFQFADGESLNLAQLLNEGAYSFGSVTNTGGGTTYYDIGPGGYEVFGSEEVYGTYVYNSSGQITKNYVLDANGQTAVTGYTWTSDGDTFQEVVTPADGSTPIIVTGGYDSQDATYTHDTTYADGSTDDITTIYNTDGTRITTEVVTPANGSGATTTVSDYSDVGSLTSVDVTNPDGSTVDSTYTYNADGSYTTAVVSTPAGGGAATTVLEFYNSAGTLTGESATAENQTLTGPTSGPDTLTGGYAGDILIGASGQDTFVYNEGSGAETIEETSAITSSSANVLQFGAGITASMIALSIGADGALVATIGTNGDSVTIDGFDPDNPQTTMPIQQFQFADGTSLTFTQLLSQVGSNSVPNNENVVAQPLDLTSSSNAWWNTSTVEYQANWHNSDGASFADDYRHESTGVTGDNWYSSMSGLLTGTTPDSGFIGLPNEGGLADPRPELSFLNPTTSPGLHSVLSPH